MAPDPGVSMRRLLRRLLDPLRRPRQPTDGELVLGHRNIQHTVRYTELGPGRFKKIRMW